MSEEKLLPGEKERYSLLTSTDLEILSKIHETEKLPNLSDKEKLLIKFIRTQLEKNWRGPILAILNEILNNKNLTSEERWKKVLERALEFWEPKSD